MDMKSTFYFALLSCLFALYSADCLGQTIKGRIVDDRNAAIEGASCVAMNPADSTMTGVAITDSEGRFEVKGTGAATVLHVSALGFEPAFRLVNADETVEISLKRQAQELEEVVVKGERPQLTLNNNGALQYDAASIRQQRIVTNAHELLKELPLITSNDGNSLDLTGAPLGHTIFINGKKPQLSGSQLTDYLKTLPADEVKDVEIIYNAPPKWRVNGAVINIELRRKLDYSYSGQIQGDYHNVSINSWDLAGSFFLQTKKWNASAMYRYADMHYRTKAIEYGRHTVGTTTYEIKDTTSSRYYEPGHSIYLTLGYDINKQNSLELTYSGAFSPDDTQRRRTTNTLTGYSESLIDTHSDLNSMTLTYKGSFLSVGVEYLNNFSSTTQDMKKSGGDQVLNDRRSQNVNRVLVYLNGNNVIAGQWRLSYGGSFEYTANTNSQNTEHFSGYEDNSQMRNTVKERIAQLYAGFSRSFFANKLTLQASLKGELYYIGDYHKHTMMPTVTMSFMPSASHILQLYYQSFRNYPSFWQRQDYEIQQDLYNIFQGNAELKPARYNVSGLSYVLKSKYVATLSYYRVNDFFLNQPYQSPDALNKITKPFNIDFTEAWILSLTAPFNPAPWYGLNLTAQGFYERYKASDWFGYSFDRRKASALFRLQNTFTLSAKPKIQLTLSGQYKLPSIVGLYDRPHTFMVQAGLSGSFLKDRLSVGVSCYDIFKSLTPTEHVRFEGQYLDTNTNFYKRAISVSATWKFGGNIEKRQKTPDTSRYGSGK